MVFRTELSITRKNTIDLQHRLLTIGSCFSDTMGQRLYQNKFNVLVNPFGTVYNPISIHRLLVMAAENAAPKANSYIEQNKVHVNYHFHSQFNALSQIALETNILSKLAEAKSQISNASFIMITYGTAWVYTEKTTSQVVANCHKMPAELFEKRLLSVQEIKEDFERLKQILQKINNKLTIILTVSPVRHLKDTLELNSISKSVLRLACHEIVQEHSQVVYFPAYEIMMDDLRDYRFYKDDLIHPTAFAEDYIWEKFEQTYFDADTIAFIKKWKEIKSALAHKPFQPYSAAHQQFLKSLYIKVSELKNIVDVEEELSFIKSQLNQESNVV